jgi:hypothetical protein
MIKKIKAFLQNDTVERVYKTFFQAFIGVLVSINIADIKDLNTVKTIVVSAVIAGTCAVWNIVKVEIDKKLSK